MDEVKLRRTSSSSIDTTADTEAILNDESIQLKECPSSQGFIIRIGNCRCFWHRPDGVPRIVIGPQWMYSFVILILALGFGGINIGMTVQMI